MKRILSIAILAVMLSATSVSAQFNLGGIIKGVANSGSNSTDTTATSGNGLGGLLKGVGDALGLTSHDVDVADIVGTWNYSAPAVVFQSENLLLKAGGSAASATVEKKLENYYKMAGFTSLQLTIDADSTFTFKVKAMTLSGTLSRDAQTGNFIFQFQALKKINLGHMESYISVKGSTMSLTFDVSKLMTLIEKAGTLTGNSTLNGVSALLKQYDGMTAGWKLTKQQ